MDFFIDLPVQSGSGPVADWSPLSTPTCQLMWESDQLLVASGGNVVSWEDQASGETVVPYGTAPTVLTNQINGLPAVSFNGTNQALQGGTTQYNNDNRAFSAYYVCKPAAFSGTQVWVPLYLPNSGVAGAASWLLLSNDPGAGDVSWGNTNPLPNGDNVNSGPLGLTTGVFQVVRVFYNGADPTSPASFTFQIGSTIVSGAAVGGATPTAGTARISLGCRFLTNDLFYHGLSAGIYYFNTNTLTTDTDALMTTYLQTKYGIS